VSCKKFVPNKGLEKIIIQARKGQEMKKASLFLAVLGVILFILIGCSGGKTGKTGEGKVIATVGKATITTGDMQDRINRQNPYVRARFSDPAKKKEFLDNMIRGEALYQKAVTLGYDKDPDVMDRVKSDMIQKMIQKEFDEKMKDSMVSADDVKKYYEDHKADYNKPEAVWIKIIQMKNKTAAEHVLKEAKAKPEDQAHFASLVKKYSEDEKTNKSGGDINYKSKDDVTKDYGAVLADEAFKATKAGEIVPKVVSSNGAFFVVKFQGIRPPQNRTLDQVESQIKNRLYYEKRNQVFEKWISDIMNSVAVTRNDALLVEVKVESSPGLPPGNPAMKVVPPQLNQPPAQGK